MIFSEKQGEFIKNIHKIVQSCLEPYGLNSTLEVDSLFAYEIHFNVYFESRYFKFSGISVKIDNGYLIDNALYKSEGLFGYIYFALFPSSFNYDYIDFPPTSKFSNLNFEEVLKKKLKDYGVLTHDEMIIRDIIE